MSLLILGGGLTLIAAFMLIHGESPRIAQRAMRTTPSPIEDRMMQPRISGSVTSLTKAIAENGNDPTLTDRPTELGGDAANTGTEIEAPTTKSIEEERSPIAKSIESKEGFAMDQFGKFNVAD